jgi:hypothetical protein
MIIQVQRVNVVNRILLCCDQLGLHFLQYRRLLSKDTRKFYYRSIFLIFSTSISGNFNYPLYWSSFFFYVFYLSHSSSFRPCLEQKFCTKQFNFTAKVWEIEIFLPFERSLTYKA